VACSDRKSYIYFRLSIIITSSTLYHFKRLKPNPSSIQLTSLLLRQLRHYTNQPRTQDVPTGHRTLLSLPVPILQTRRGPMRRTSTTRPRCPGEDSPRRIRLRSTLEAASQARSEIWTAIATRLWLFELEDLRSIHLGFLGLPIDRRAASTARSTCRRRISISLRAAPTSGEDVRHWRARSCTTRSSWGPSFTQLREVQ